MNLADYLVIVGFIGGLVILIGMLVLVRLIYDHDKHQKQHPVLRNYPLLGKMRYFLEKLGPELRQYLYNSDTEGKPFSRFDYEMVVKSAKYQRDVLSFGSLRDFDEAGFYIRNALFPKQTQELKFDREATVETRKYLLLKDPLFTSRKEKFENSNPLAYLLNTEDAVVIGRDCRYPFVVRGQVGMSAMSFGALGHHAISALSLGLAMAKGTWMNTGEGGLSPYHLKGDIDIIMQIGPGLFGVRDKDGNFDWNRLKEKSEISQVRAFELKLAQGAKARGGHVDGEKVTQEIADIRMVEPYQSIDSPNRFNEFHSLPEMFQFINRMKEHTGKPVGIKIVVGSKEEADELASFMAKTHTGPDFITIDGGEGGTGATYQELADSVGLPIKSSLPLMHQSLVRYGVRDRVILIASGKMFSPDRIAIALSMGADLVNVARGLMIAIGCIQSLKCHANICPVGVATTDEHLQQGLVVDEKKYRVANYVITLRKGLFRLAAAAGLDSPVQFSTQNVVYKDAQGRVQTLAEIYEKM
ncbi:FMN-binding glutamate synthase family protein [Alicyclobacillus sp. SO9]|uniref:FMN-binding glutamate synthase family protein n=1 Tax=Alicyclobacillus sp. SO9 TaxID=2665646 RepID=UPI0018E713F8|nr:FMN-binding glutamate synthase family protein [Alicyclobacillus sp. SO9]QQE79907.1 FMN-binding glutamate synthase family protein [Alicyclobacillus sp. SO9]